MRHLSLILACLVLPLVVPAGAQAVVVGSGGQPGALIGPGGTAYVAYKVDTYGPADAVELCVLGPKARACAPRTRIAFPGKGYNATPVSLHFAPDGGLLVVAGREVGNDYGVWVARSLDGGASFGAPVAVAEGFAGPTAITPDGRLGIISDASSSVVGAAALNGADALRDRPTLSTITPNASITTIPTGTVVASSAARTSRAWVLPTGADGFAAASWQLLPPLNTGYQPHVSGGRAGLGVALERGRTGLQYRRLDGARWTRPRSLGGPSTNDGFDLTQDASGRLYAAWANDPVSDSRTRIEAVISYDRGATWSSIARLARTRDGVFGDALEVAVGADGKGVVVSFDDKGRGTGQLGPVSVQRISPKRIPVAQHRVGRAVVSLLAGRDESCVEERYVPVRLQASVDGNPVSVGRFVRGASFKARARRLRGGSKVSVRYTLNRGRTRVTARVKPRKGKAFSLRVPMRACL